MIPKFCNRIEFLDKLKYIRRKKRQEQFSKWFVSSKPTLNFNECKDHLESALERKKERSFGLKSICPNIF